MTLARLLTTISALLWLCHGAAYAQGAPNASPDENPAPARLEEARGAFLAGNAFLEKGDLDDAIAAFETSFAAAGRPSALFMLGVSYRRRFEASGDLDDARKSLEQYQRFINQDPSHRKVQEARDTTTLLASLLSGAEKRRAAGAGEAALTGSREYRQALGFFGEGRFVEAEEAASAARAKSTSGAEEVSELWALVGRAQALGGKSETAVESFQKAISLNPKLRIVTDIDALDAVAFDKARSALRGKAPLAIAVRGKAMVQRGEAITLSLHVDSDPMNLVAGLVLSYRWEGNDSFTDISASTGAEILIPATRESGSPPERVFYFLTALDGVGAPIATSGSPRNPLSVSLVSEAEWNLQFPTTNSGSAALRLGGLASVAVGTGAIILGILQGLEAKKESDALQREHPASSVGAGTWSIEAERRLNDALDAERNMIILASFGAAAVVGGGLVYYLGRGSATEAKKAPTPQFGMSAGASTTAGVVTISGVF